MLSVFRSAAKISDLRQRIIFTLLMFAIFRLGVFIPVPGVNHEVLENLFRGGTLFGLLDLFAGGALRKFSIFAMNVTPYINASIIIQLLTIVIPQLEQLSKEGEEGRRKIVQYTRYGTVILGLVQALGMSIGLARQGALLRSGITPVLVIAITLTAGTAFLMWLGEQITEKGIGNGISLLIFAGIVSRLPEGMARIFSMLRAGTVTIFNLFLLTVAGLLVIAAVVWITEGQRKIPVNYAKRVVGRRMYGGQSTHLPLRINTAGVIPVIFSTSILAFPVTLAQFIQHPVVQKAASFLSFTGPAYNVLNFLLIIFFTYFYTAITFNPSDVADNIKKYGGFIPGIRPGRPTAEYLDRVLTRITLVGAVFLATIAVMPNFFQGLTNIPNLYFGGTALLIVVGVALETMKQIEAHIIMRHYQGFIR